MNKGLLIVMLLFTGCDRLQQMRTKLFGRKREKNFRAKYPLPQNTRGRVAGAYQGLNREKNPLKVFDNQQDPLEKVVTLCQGYVQNMDTTLNNLLMKKVQNNKDNLNGDNKAIQSCVVKLIGHMETGKTEALDNLIFWQENTGGQNKKVVDSLVARGPDIMPNYFFGERLDYIKKDKCKFSKKIPPEVDNHGAFLLGRVKNLMSLYDKLPDGQSKDWVEKCLLVLKDIPGNNIEKLIEDRLYQ